MLFKVQIPQGKPVTADDLVHLPKAFYFHIQIVVFKKTSGALTFERFSTL